MNRPLFFIIVLFIGLQVYLVWEIGLLKMSAARYETESRLATALTQDQELVSREQFKQIRKNFEDLAGTDPADSQALPQQLLLAQGMRLDYLVDWIDIIESRVYFLLFPPAQQSERERTAAELQSRTDKTKGDFFSVSQRSHQLRDLLLKQAADKEKLAKKAG